jgi:tetratricopeptide (TPR) repeat protein
MAVPAIAANLAPLLARRRWPSRLTTGLAVASLAGIAVVIGLVVTNQMSRLTETQREFGIGVSRARFPEDAIAFVSRAGIRGRAFNCLAMGGYLTWTRPDDAVFVDGRLEAFPEDVFRGYFRVMDDPSAWPEITAPYALDYALVYHGWSNRFPLAKYLARGHGWSLVYYDEIASIFVPDDDAHRDMRARAIAAFAEIRKERQAAPEPVPASTLERTLAVPVADTWRQRAYGDYLRQIGVPADAVTAYRRSLALDPDQAEARFALGFAYWDSGRREDAIREWRELLRRHPETAQVKQVLMRAGGAG